MKKKLGVIGLGSAGISSLGHFCYVLDNTWEIISIHNPKKDILGIGESTNANFVSVLEYSLGFSYDNSLDELDGTLKFGTKFINWRKDSWINPLIEGNLAIHFNTFKLKDYALPRLKNKWSEKFKILEGEVSTIKQDENEVAVCIDGNTYQFDFLIDCRGFPENFDDYTISDCSLVNRCLVYDDSVFDSIQYTEHYATENGWMFGIPLNSRKTYGYLYNDTITTKEEAIKDLRSTLNLKKKNIDFREYSFKSYYANKILDGRILKNGNRGIFFEPISATSIYMYVKINYTFAKFLSGEYGELDVNQQFRNDAEDLENVIRYYYHGGSTFDSTFWKIASENAIMQLSKNCKFYEMINEIRRIKNNGTPYDYPGYIFPAISWYKLDSCFEYNYFNGNEFIFDDQAINNHRRFIENRFSNEAKLELYKTNKNYPDQFRNNGYCYVENAINPLLVEIASLYALNDTHQNFSPESENAQIPGTHSKYADPLMEAILLHVHSTMEYVTGLELYPTYSYYRVYKPGDELKVHKDRESCEISCTVCFKFDYKELQGNYQWPIFMEGNSVNMLPGDLVAYRGCDLHHRREEFKVPEGSYHVQAFFHYVDKNGPFKDFKFDRRPFVGFKKEETISVTAKEISKSYITYTE